MLTIREIYRVVYDYIGVDAGYLRGFTYGIHQEFYPRYCDLDIDPLEYRGTTRARFINILKKENPINQAKILKGVLDKFPVSSFPEEEGEEKLKIKIEIEEIIRKLKGYSPITSPNLAITSNVVERSINDAKTLMEKSGATSGVDRIHTALHGYLKAVCKKQNFSFPSNASLTILLKIIRKEHSAFKNKIGRDRDIERILLSLGTILDALNPIRNLGSVAHPNIELLEEDEAMLVINTAQTILHYLNSKFK